MQIVGNDWHGVGIFCQVPEYMYVEGQLQVGFGSGTNGCKMRNETGNNQRENSCSWCGCFLIEMIKNKQSASIMSHLCMMVDKGTHPLVVLKSWGNYHASKCRERTMYPGIDWNKQSSLVWYILDTLSWWQTNPEDLAGSSCGTPGQAVSKTGQPIAEEQLVEERRSYSRGEGVVNPDPRKYTHGSAQDIILKKYLFQHTPGNTYLEGTITLQVL